MISCGVKGIAVFSLYSAIISKGEPSVYKNQIGIRHDKKGKKTIFPIKRENEGRSGNCRSACIQKSAQS